MARDVSGDMSPPGEAEWQIERGGGALWTEGVLVLLLLLPVRAPRALRRPHPRSTSRRPDPSESGTGADVASRTLSAVCSWAAAPSCLPKSLPLPLRPKKKSDGSVPPISQELEHLRSLTLLSSVLCPVTPLRPSEKLAGRRRESTDMDR